MPSFLTEDQRWDMLASLTDRERAFVTRKIERPEAKAIDIVREIEPELKSASQVAAGIMRNELVTSLLEDSSRRAFHAAGVSASKITAELAHIAFGGAEELMAQYGGLDVKMAHKLEALKKLGETQGMFIDRKQHGVDDALAELLSLGEDSDTGPGPSRG